MWRKFNWSLILTVLTSASTNFGYSVYPDYPTTCGVIPTDCKPTKYRTYDGSCNNMKRGWWGTPGSWYERLYPNNYGDGIYSYPRSKNNESLPNSRKVSMLAYPDILVDDPTWTLVLMVYGQLISHDLSLSSGIAQSPDEVINCCKRTYYPERVKTDPGCAPIKLPSTDPYNAPRGIICMHFRRTETTINGKKCKGAPKHAEQITDVNSYLDASFLYGNNDEIAKKMRTFKGGQLDHVIRNGRQWFPQVEFPNEKCFVKNATKPCYFTGDKRVNQNPQLAIMHTLYLVQHNNIADRLTVLNPHWDDERLFQETRRIIISIHQHITYYDYLPHLLGENRMLENKLIYSNQTEYNTDYDPEINPNPINEFSTAAFRFSHTTISGFPKKFNSSRISRGEMRLSQWFFQPEIIEDEDNFDLLTIGMTYFSQSAPDRYYTNEITQHLFRNPDALSQLDLKSIDIERSRDHGLAPYVQVLQGCGILSPKSFEDLKVLIDPNVVDKVLKPAYNSYEDIDLTVGSSMEKSLRSVTLGPTNACIVTEQFRRTRKGDSFFYENGNHAGAFTLDQLNAIRKYSSLANFICDTNKDVKKLQKEVFLLPSKKNPLVDCEQLPKLDLTPWKDTAQAA